MTELEVLLEEAQELGIVDVDCHGDQETTAETVRLAIELMKKHGPKVYKQLEARRRAQQLNTYEEISTNPAKLNES